MVYRDVQEVLDLVGETLIFLGEKLIDVNQPGHLQNTPLSVVICWGDFDATSLLISCGADVSMSVEDDNTPLHLAVLFGNIKIVRLILDHGGDPHVKNRFGHTAADMCRDHEIIELLRT